MKKVVCRHISCFWGPKGSTQDEITLTTEKQNDTLSKVRRGASCTSYYSVKVYEDDVLIEEFTSDFNIVKHLREETEVIDIFRRHSKDTSQ